MQTQRTSISKAVAILIGLAVVFAALIIAADSTGDTFARQVMTSLGSAIFGGGVAFFLIQMFQWEREPHA